MNGREFLDEYEGRNRDTNETVSVAKVNIRLERGEIEARVSRLKEFKNEYVVRYVDVVMRSYEIWVGSS